VKGLIAIVIAVAASLLLFDSVPDPQTGSTTLEPVMDSVVEPTTYYDHFLQEELAVVDLPFFLRGYQQYGPDTDAFERQGELYRWLRSTKARYMEGGSLIWDGICIERDWNYLGHDVQIVFVQYQMVGGEVVCNYPTGVVYLAEEAPYFPILEESRRAGKVSEEEFLAARRQLSWDEFGKVEYFLHGMLEEAVEWLWKDLGPLEEYLVATASEQLGVTSIFEEIPYEIDPPLTVGDVLGVPYMCKEQILPDVLYYGPLTDAAAWMTVGSNIWLRPNYSKAERRMAIHEQWVGYDWIRGCPQITRHELVHAWQSIPLGWYYDVELWNEMYSHAIDVDEIAFLSHSYLERIRSIARRYWSFDSQAAWDALFAFEAGQVTKISRERFEEMGELVQIISDELRKNAMDLYRAFYKDPLFYIALQELCHDDQMAVDLLYAQMYEPTCLGGVIETQRWQQAHANEIEALAKEALRETETQENEIPEELLPDWSMASLSIWQRLPESVREELAAAYDRYGIEGVVALLGGGAK